MSIRSIHPLSKQHAFVPTAPAASGYEQAIRTLLGSAGVQVGGQQPYDLRVHDARFYRRVLRQGSLGFGESYMQGWWDCPSIDSLISRLLQANVDEAVKDNPHVWWQVLRARLFNLQSFRRAYQVADAHYNLGNDLFVAMLDRNLCYSCAYWKGAEDLDQAQANKLDLLCRKLDLQPGEHVLDIGCGWGSFAHYAATHYGVRVTGVTVSSEQQKLAQERCRGLPVDIQLLDYRKLDGRYDKLVSIGMFEHVGRKNYPAYFDVAQRVLKDGGLFALHTIGNDRVTPVTDPWIERYIFPNGSIPALGQIASACEAYFLIDDVQNFGPDYDTTLMAWKRRFDAAWSGLSQRYDERFRRMWVYYLSACAGGFRSGQMQLYQVVMRHRNRQRARYDAPR
ncbi:MAG: cyclopropane fatty acyl phospholipid synthase [Gammaproteobacteria bacterium]|nr:cyclopropane fatty acyl phospholipid synthase [Gammaproteobacteria bacterium]MBU1725695.1 cyclopropane fatty acyl phospholipid synthase [Gammaproteobacteria bacterium]MBU2003953.1 cyclopropane fatty acyl phospholipid synthase [Gammaproteobacteria bacterium]